jgi:uncharacterized protein (TIGR03437 family)
VKIDPKALTGDTPFARAAVYSSLPGVSLGGAVIGADAAGNAYVGVYTYCNQPGPIEPVRCVGGLYDTVVGVFKLNATGARLIWVANPFGTSATDLQGIAVSPAGDVHIAGNTQSSDFPVTKGAYRTLPFPGGWTGFIAKLKSGSNEIEWATYLSGVGDAYLIRTVVALAVDARGNTYVGGLSPTAEIPELNSVQSKFGLTLTGFLTVVRPDGGGLVWSTPLGTGFVSQIGLGPTGAVYAAGTVNPGKTIANISDRNFGDQTIAIAKIESAGSPVRIDAVVNAASFEAGLPLAGGLATMWVDRPVDPGAVSILVGGAPAFLMWAAGRQINFQVPYEGNSAAAPSARYAVEVRFDGLSSFALPQASGPGVFTLAGGLGAVQHGSDYSLVSRDHPVAPGEVVIVYVTGLGHAPLQKTGVPPSGPAWATNCYPPTTNAGDVLYAGVTPGVIGVYQVNIRLRADLPSGDFRLVVTRNDCSPPPLTPAYPAPGPIKRDSNPVTLPVR